MHQSNEYESINENHPSFKSNVNQLQYQEERFNFEIQQITQKGIRVNYIPSN